MTRYLKNLVFLALLCLGFAAQAQTTNYCDKGNPASCAAMPTAPTADLSYALDHFVRGVLLPPLLGPTTSLCQENNSSDCRSVPTASINDLINSMNHWVRLLAMDEALTAIAAADPVSTSEMASAIATALNSYSTTAQTQAIADAAAADAVEGYVTEAQLDDYATEAEAEDIAEGVTTAALADYSTTAETQTIANEAAADAVEGYVTTAQLDNYVTEGELGSYVTAPEAEDIAEGVTTTALTNYSTTAQTEAIAENAAGLAAMYKADLNQVGNIATGVVEQALLDYSTSDQVQDMIDTAVANALASYTPTSQGIAKGWFSREAGNNHSYNMTKLNANQYRLNVTIAAGKRVIPVVTSINQETDCHASSFDMGSTSQPVIQVTCKPSNTTGSSATPDQLTIVVFTSN